MMEASPSSKDACRLCDQNSAKMYSIFSKNTEGQQILHLIKECLPLIVSIELIQPSTNSNFSKIADL